VPFDVDEGASMLPTAGDERTSKRMMPSRPFIAAVLLLCGVYCTSSSTRAQQPTAPSSSVTDLDRIRDRLAQAPSIFAVDVVPDYRVRVETDEEDLRLKLAWIYDDSVVPGYVRPWYPIYHFEMQQMMLPTEFRAHLYPMGMPVSNPVKAFSDALRQRREQAARERIRAELEALRKAAAEKPQ
jgi:hypothetical protein